MKIPLILFLFSAVFWASSIRANDLESQTKQLVISQNYDEKATLIEQITQATNPAALLILEALVDGRLYLNKTSQQPVIGVSHPDGISIRDALTNAELGVVGVRSLIRSAVNNQLRGQLRTAIASRQLKSMDYQMRMTSAQELAKNPDTNMRALLLEAHQIESVVKVKRKIALALAMIDIHSEVPSLRLKAARVLGKSYSSEALGALSQLAEKNETGQFIEQDVKLAQLAESGVYKIKNRMDLMKIIENLFFGFSLGSVLLLAAIGLAITFGVMGVINMAHGEMIMLGAYTTFAVQQLFPQWIEMSILIAIPAAFVVSGSVGIIIERTIIRHLYGRPLETLLATFGISLFLQQLVRTYNANNVPVIMPHWMSGFYSVNDALSFTYNRIYIIVFSVVVLLALAFLLRKTYLGLQMRAVTQNRAMANSMGIQSGWVDALTFGLGSGIAGIAGVALSQITNVGPNMGQGFIIDSFMVVVFGGVGNLLGTFFAAMGLGVVNKFLEPYAGAVLGKIMVLIFIILFIQWRPRGLFALKGRFVAD